MNNYDLTEKQKLLLEAVRGLDSPTNQRILDKDEISEFYSSTKSLSNMMRKLETKYNYIKSKSGERNKKAYELTSEGKKALEKVLRKERQKVDRENEGFTYSEKVEEFSMFLEENEKANEDLNQACLSGRNYVLLNIAEFEKFNPDLADDVLENEDTLRAFEDAVEEMPQVEERKDVRLTNVPERENKSVSDKNDEDLGKIVVYEGLVKSVTDAKLVLKSAVFECSKCGELYEKDQKSSKLKSPYKCECGNKKFECVEKNYQTVRVVDLEEKPDESNSERITVFVEGDLAKEKSKHAEAGGRPVKVIGRLEPKDSNQKSEMEDFVIRANNIELEDSKWENLEITESDIEEFEHISNRDDLPEYLRKSFAHEELENLELLKETFILWLLGRTERSNLHVLCIGEDGTGKSNLAKIVSQNIPRVTKSVGQGASEVGLTGAVVKNDMTGEWSAEAGALPMADGGFHITDEVDKLDEDHRSAFNEALSDQEVSIEKANINATMSADVSEFAIGNPEGDRRFQSDIEPLTKQFTIDENDLLSRFGIKIAIQYETDPERERNKAKKILTRDEDVDLELEPQDNLLGIEKISKYIVHSQSFNPVLTEETISMIEEIYMNLFKENQTERRLIDSRNLETLKLLCIAYARMHLSEEVESEHVKMATDFLKRAYASLGLTIGKDPMSESNKGQNRDRVIDRVREVVGNDRKEKQEIVESLDVEEERVENVLESMKSEGEIYELEPGVVKAL